MNDERNIRDDLSDGLAVRELIDALKECDPDAVVVFGCDYGDRGNTEQALPVSEVQNLKDVGRLSTSGYSVSGVAIVRDDDPTDDPPENVVVLS